MYIGLIFKILLIHMFAVASPGPDFLIVTKNALNFSRKIGVWTAIGIAMGIGVHVIYGIGGIAVLIAQNEDLYKIIKYAGSLYLLYLAFQSFRSVKKKNIVKKDSNVRKGLTSLSAFKNGFITNVLNPKATMFFLGVFSAMIPPLTPSYVLITIALLLILNTGLWFVLVAHLFTRATVQKAFYKYESKVNIVYGVLLIVLAFSI